MHSKEKGWTGGTRSSSERFESDLTAIDPVTGDVKKSLHLPYPNTSGLATGGGVIFLGLTDGTVAAYDDVTLANCGECRSGFNADDLQVNGEAYLTIASGLTQPPGARGTAGTQGQAQRDCAVCLWA
jgi:hypothetical protein